MSNQQTPDGAAISFPSLNHPQVLLQRTLTSHVLATNCTQPRKVSSPHTQKFFAEASGFWCVFSFRESKNIFRQLKDDFTRYHLILCSRKNWHKSVPHYS